MQFEYLVGGCGAVLAVAHSLAHQLCGSVVKMSTDRQLSAFYRLILFLRGEMEIGLLMKH